MRLLGRFEKWLFVYGMLKREAGSDEECEVDYVSFLGVHQFCIARHNCGTELRSF